MPEVTLSPLFGFAELLVDETCVLPSSVDAAMMTFAGREDAPVGCAGISAFVLSGRGSVGRFPSSPMAFSSLSDGGGTCCSGLPFTALETFLGGWIAEAATYVWSQRTSFKPRYRHSVATFAKDGLAGT